jgi:O-succinylbenzoic acid--CoA ligase
VIITGGENISLAAVEKVVRDTFTGIECAAFAIADTHWGQVIHLAIAGSIQPDKSEINEALSSQISEAAKVKRFIYLDKLPRTSLDKIDRQRLIELALGDTK